MATLIEQLAPKETVEQLEHSLAQELPAQIDALFPGLAEKIREGTASLEDVESLLQHVSSVPSGLKVPLLQFLRLKKGWLLLRHDRAKPALRESEEVLKISEPAPKAWTLKAIALLRLERFAEACKAFERAYQLQNTSAVSRTYT